MTGLRIPRTGAVHTSINLSQPEFLPACGQPTAGTSNADAGVGLHGVSPLSRPMACAQVLGLSVLLHPQVGKMTVPPSLGSREDEAG